MTTPMRLAAAIIATTLPAIPADAHPGTPLQRAAADTGYAYAWSVSTSEVTLTRPGHVLTIRPGTRRYLIDDHVAYAADAPVYENGDLLVSADVVNELRTLAGSTLGPRATDGARGSSAATASGAITLHARALSRDQIAVDGTSPAGLPVTLTLVAHIDRDVPDVLLRRVNLATDGTYHATVDVATGLPRGSVVTITASSLPGVSTTTATVTIPE